MYIREYRLQKTWLDKCLKSRVAEDSETNNISNRSKLCCNRNGSTFEIFINHFEGSCSGKSLLSDTQNPKVLC